MKTSKIIFVTGPISSGKSTVSGLIKNSARLDIDDIYSEHAGGRDFELVYGDKRFQESCWRDFYEKIRRNRLKNRLVVAQTTGTNPRFNRMVSRLKKEFPNSVYVIRLDARKEAILNRTKRRTGRQRRKISSAMNMYAKIRSSNSKYDFVIHNDRNLGHLRKKIDEIMNISHVKYL